MARTTTTEPSGTPDLDEFTHHWQDEADAAFLYRHLAAAEQDASKRDIYQRLADVEDRHVQVWGDLLAQHGRPPGPFKPTARTRLLVAVDAVVIGPLADLVGTAVFPLHDALGVGVADLGGEEGHRLAGEGGEACVDPRRLAVVHGISHDAVTVHGRSGLSGW